MSNEIEVACPNCHVVYTVAACDIGREGTCLDCGAKFYARRWNWASSAIVAAIMLALIYGLWHYEAERDPYRRRPAGVYIAVGVPGMGGVVAVGR